jgi:hypothetical protein
MTTITPLSPLGEKPNQPNRPLTVLVPLAGAESRHVVRGLSALPQLTVAGSETVLQHSLRSADIMARYVFVVRADHHARFNLGYLLQLIVPRAEIITIDRPTEGALCSALAAADHLDASDPLILMHSDQILRWSSQAFIHDCFARDLDAAVVTCRPHESGWRYNYVRTNNEGSTIVEVAAKKAISPLATAGVFYWRRARDFIGYARQVQAKRQHSNGIYHLIAAYAPAIAEHRNIGNYTIEPIVDLSTPEGVASFCASLSPQLRRAG